MVEKAGKYPVVAIVGMLVGLMLGASVGLTLRSPEASHTESYTWKKLLHGASFHS